MKLRLLIPFLLLSWLSFGQKSVYLTIDKMGKPVSTPAKFIMQPVSGVAREITAKDILLITYSGDSIVDFVLRDSIPATAPLFMSGANGARIVSPTGAMRARAVVTPKTYTDSARKAYNEAAIQKVRKKAVAAKGKMRALTLPGDIVWSAPIIIQKGGKYTANYRSDDSNTPAVQIWTNEPVELTGAYIASAGDMIKTAGNTNLNIHHNTFVGLLPTGNNQWGRALNDYQPGSLKFENNYIEHTGGILVDHTSGNAPPVTIRYNLIRNTDKRRTDNSTGDHRAGILFNTVPKAKGEISWNQFENVADSSHIEDNVNLYNSGGSDSATAFAIHDNYIKGAYPWPLNADYYTGSGITADGDPTTNQYGNMTQFINIYNNQVISTCNAAINIAAGHDVHVYGNTMISAGMFPNGVTSQRFWGGCAIWDGSNVGAALFKNNYIRGNTIGYVRPDVNTPLPGRQDWVVVSNSPLSVQPNDNISLANPITLATENAELPKWQAKLKANNISVGNAVNSPVIVISGTTVKLGGILKGTINPVDSLGKTVAYKPNSITVTGDAYLKTARDSVNDKLFTVTGSKAGIGAVTVTITSMTGKVITKKINVEVLAPLPEISDVLITLTP